MSNSRNLRIEPVPSSSLVRVAWDGGGEIPDKLKGAFTSPAAAKQAIIAWSAEKDREVEVRVLTDDEEQAKQAKVKTKPL